ncbi:type II toxin-antitoxin system VapC family toxin [Endothiovibrio diazotrophicus]
MLLDSNIVIYAASGRYPALNNWLAEQDSMVSAISVLEVLGYHKLQPEERAELEVLFSQMAVTYPDPTTFRLAVDLRQQRRISLGDALIAATALHWEVSLATHNLRDFSWIPGLLLFDPVAEHTNLPPAP